MTPTEQKAFDALRVALKTVLGYTENWPASFTVHDCWKWDSALAREALTAANTVSEQQFCYCNPDVSLQMVSGGGAPEGYLGCVTLRIGDQYRDYHSHHQATEPAWRPIETAPKDGTLYLAREGADMWVENAPEGHFAGNWVWSESRRQWRGHAHSDDRFATHWQPLPTAPEAKQ